MYNEEEIIIKVTIIELNNRKLKIELIIITILMVVLILTVFNGKSQLQICSNKRTKKIIISVPVMNQLPQLPTGCEATSTAMLLQWAGLKISKEEIAKSLPKGKIPYWSKGQLLGGNPDYEFVGNPFSKSGFGVFHKPIKDVINLYLPNQAKDVTGCSFNYLLYILDTCRPVVVWVTIGMTKPSVNCTWHDRKGNKVIWKVPQHAVLLVGYTKTNVLYNDPLTGNMECCSISVFKNIWSKMGNQAVTVKIK